MNFYHFKPSCKVIKRSRATKIPILSNYEHDMIAYIFQYEQMVIRNGKLNLQLFGLPHIYSRKVFVGGLPLDINEAKLLQKFSKFGAVLVDWPYKENAPHIIPPKGFVFLLFTENVSVDNLLQNCRKRNGENYFTTVSTNSKGNKSIQVIPWKLDGIDHFFVPLSQVNPRFTIFLGGVPRTFSAEQIGIIMNCLFGEVAYVGIDVDPLYFYPKGSARVIFMNKDSVVSAIKKRFVMPAEIDSRKMMEMKPYIMDDQACDRCKSQNYDEKSTLFCAEPECLSYLCEFCWIEVHSQLKLPNINPHVPVVKQGRDDYASAIKKTLFECLMSFFGTVFYLNF